MSYKKMIPFINAENEHNNHVIQLAEEYDYNGADELFLYNYVKDEASQHEFLNLAKEVTKRIDVPVLIGIHVNRFEDVKKALYTGASQVVIRYESLKNTEVIKESVERFGTDKIWIEFDYSKGAVPKEVLTELTEYNCHGFLLKHVVLSDTLLNAIKEINMPIIIRDGLIRNDLSELLQPELVVGVSTNYFEQKDLMKAKNSLVKEGIPMNTFESSIEFKDFKLNSDGMIPVVTQDYKTKEVLMLAYMNEEAFYKTIETGKMTYYSRSRNELWTKGLTSGHLQYVKSLTIDCDNDTILAKVLQIGSACHTGNQSCFYTDLVKKEYEDINPLTVFEEVYQVIMDRKQNPKEGSYTNYLFDKGIDKILKKCGEEATEIVIAAKNPDAEELKYEISDYLYHLMVLMAECGIDWNDVIKELAHRR